MANGSHDVGHEREPYRMKSFDASPYAV